MLTKNNLQNTFYKTNKTERRYQKLQMLKVTFFFKGGRNMPVILHVEPQAVSGNTHMNLTLVTSETGDEVAKGQGMRDFSLRAT